MTDEEREGKPYKCRNCGGSEFIRYGSRQYRNCKTCIKSSHRGWYHRNRDKVAQLRKADYERGKKHYAKYGREWKLRNRYGITSKQYSEMLAAQNGNCAICQDPPTLGRHLTVDHCHTSGKVRALLCDSCNVGLAKFKDSPDNLRLAAIYLEEHRDATTND